MIKQKQYKIYLIYYQLIKYQSLSISYCSHVFAILNFMDNTKFRHSLPLQIILLRKKEIEEQITPKLSLKKL